jgi:hypothetical protein
VLLFVSVDINLRVPGSNVSTILTLERLCESCGECKPLVRDLVRVLFLPHLPSRDFSIHREEGGPREQKGCSARGLTVVTHINYNIKADGRKEKGISRTNWKSKEGLR